MKKEIPTLTIGQRIAQQREIDLQAKALRDKLAAGSLVQAFGQPGGERRRAILAYLATGEKIYVNCKWQLQVKRDPDLQRLLKEKKVVLRSDAKTGHRFEKHGGIRNNGLPGGELLKRGGKSQSYLVLAGR